MWYVITRWTLFNKQNNTLSFINLDISDLWMFLSVHKIVIAYKWNIDTSNLFAVLLLFQPWNAIYWLVPLKLEHMMYLFLLILCLSSSLNHNFCSFCLSIICIEYFHDINLHICLFCPIYLLFLFILFFLSFFILFTKLH